MLLRGTSNQYAGVPHLKHICLLWRVSKNDADEAVTVVSLSSSSGEYINGRNYANLELLIDKTSSIYLYVKLKLNQGNEHIRLIRSLRKFIFRYQDIVEIYSVSVDTIINDAFS
jgi:hypothetical protein